MPNQIIKTKQGRPVLGGKPLLDASLKDFIGVFDNAISQEICDHLMEDFELNYSQNLAFNRPQNGAHKDVKGQTHFIDDDAVDYTEPRSEWVFNDRKSSGLLLEGVGRCFGLYKNYAARGFMGMQQDIFVNTVKVQRTSPGQGYHTWHCEQGSRGFSHRFLFYIAYLNDVETGGETEFLHYSRRIEPKAGKVLIAPASFTHTHRGNPPLSGNKYIATGWIEF